MILKEAGASNKLLKFTQQREFGWVFQLHRKTYQPREGLRTVKDLKEEEKERKERREEDPLSYTIFGNKRKNLRDLFFYTDRPAGKGYTSFANTNYESRPYVWPPLRKMFFYSNFFFYAFLIIMIVDFEWLYFHIKKYLETKWSS